MFYFIISLPRCGTAWLANALTWGNSYCHHEGIYGFDKMNDYTEMLRATDAKYIGDSDTGLSLILPWLYRAFPDAKYIFIKRDIDAVKSSLETTGFSTHGLPEIQRSIEWGMQHMDKLTVNFKDVFTDTRRIWDYIGLGEYPQERFEMLRHMKIDDSQKYLHVEPINYSNLMRSAA